jgi:hypothetical protein
MIAATLFLLGAAVQAPATAPPATPPPAPAPKVAACDARPWKRLVGLTMAEVLAARLPEGARVHRADDPAPPRAATRDRLTVEVGRGGRVRKVHCG